MPFWTYMLHCRGGYFYVGHTDDLERRIGDHKSGLIPGFTADHLPVELAWSDEFCTRDEAKDAERKLKGWSRAKKLALIRGDWDRISALAKKKGDPSTSSGQADVEELVDLPSVHAELVEAPYFSLQPHLETPSISVRTVQARILALTPHWLTLRWRIEGTTALVVAPFAGKGRADGLWQTTCFELFIRSGADPAYAEFNLSPSEQWAAYDFETYREGMRNRPAPIMPTCTLRRGSDMAIFDAAIPASALPPLPWSYGLTAVIEETGGIKSCWAFAHPPAKPDFHHPACFAATLAAPGE